MRATRHPTGLWITQQLREAFPYDSQHKYLILDRDAKFGTAVSEGVEALGLKTVRTSFRSPWQNGVAERWVGTCRRDLLDHVISSRRATPETPALRIHSLLPPRPNPFEIRERHAPSKTSGKIGSSFPDCFISQTRWSASSLRPSCIVSVDFRLCILRAQGKVCPKAVSTHLALFVGARMRPLDFT
jgi:hypothetical protein